MSTQANGKLPTSFIYECLFGCVSSSVRMRVLSYRSVRDNASILKRFGTAKKNLKTMTVNGAFLRYLKRFGTAKKKLKTRTVNGAFLRYLKRFGTTETTLKQCIDL